MPSGSTDYVSRGPRDTFAVKQRTFSGRKDVVLLGFSHVLPNLLEQLLHLQLDFRVTLRTTFDGHVRNVISTTAVANHHVKGRRRRSFLAIACDCDTVEFWAAEEKALQLIGMSAVIEMYVSIRSEKCVEIIVAQGMRVGALKS